MQPVPAAYAISGSDVPTLAASVEAGVFTGALAPGSALPSVRSLAAAAGVSPTTAAAAYRLLRDRGVIRTVPRIGAVVSDLRPVAPVAEIAAPDVVEGMRDLARGNPDPALLPDLETLLSAGPFPTRLYGAEPVVAELAEAFAAQCRIERVETAAFTVVNGAMDGVERVLAASLRAGDRVAVEDPGYPGVHAVVRALRLEPVAVRLDDVGVDPDALVAALNGGVSALVLSPRGQNPTGAVLSEAKATALRAALEARPGVLVVEDDHLGALGEPCPTVTTGRARWALVRSAAKALGPDLRLAVVTGDPGTVTRVEARFGMGPGWVSGLVQLLAARAWTDPSAVASVERARAVYAGRRDAVLGALARRGIAASGASGLNVWVPVASEGVAVASLAQRGWAVRPGVEYRLASPPGVRITVAALPESDAERLADDVAAAVRPATRRTRSA